MQKFFTKRKLKQSENKSEKLQAEYDAIKSRLEDNTLTGSYDESLMNKKINEARFKTS